MPETKNASGYFAAPDMDAIDLFIGSDGTLGVITELEIMILPLPSHIWAVTAFFAGERQALDYVLSVRRGIKQVAAVEYFDGDALHILRSQKKNNGAFSKLPELPEDGRAAVYVEFHCEGEDTARMRLLEAVALMEAAGGSEEKTLIACDGNELKTLHFLRHAIPESVNMLIRQRKKKDPVITKLGTDMAVPDEYLLEVMEMYRRGLREENLESAVWGHIGNNHVHVNILPGSAEEYHRGKALYQKWAREVARMGGAVSAEHAVGKLKADFLAAMYGPGHIGEMRALKNAFDPGNLIGRGICSASKRRRAHENRARGKRILSTGGVRLNPEIPRESHSGFLDEAANAAGTDSSLPRFMKRILSAPGSSYPFPAPLRLVILSPCRSRFPDRAAVSGKKAPR
jgi:D-lactate dehydrogenase (cytochrome)